MQKLYKRLFYRLYKWSYNRYGDYDDPAFTAVISMSFLISFNILTILFFWERLSTVAFFKILLPNKFGIIAFGLLMFGINYYKLHYKGKGKKVIAEQEKLDEKEYRLENVIITIYIISTPILFVISLLCLPVSE